jgi:hypothetical protein
MKIIDKILKWTTYCEYSHKDKLWKRKLRIGKFFRWVIKETP